MKNFLKSTFSTHSLFDLIFENTVFKVAFFIVFLTLMSLPFFTTFSEFLTVLALKSQLYNSIQNLLTPILAQMVAVILEMFGVTTNVVSNTISFVKNDKWTSFYIAWNCIGWQSMILLVITLFTGLQGPYDKVSKLMCILFGFFGTFLVNILRVTAIFLLAYYVNEPVAKFFHNYGATVTVVLWLFTYWFVSYSYILVLPESLPKSEANTERA